MAYSAHIFLIQLEVMQQMRRLAAKVNARTFFDYKIVIIFSAIIF